MSYDPDKHRRRSIRLKGYDYAQSGAYFVTVCAQDRACVFGAVIEGEVQLSEAGHIAAACWRAIPDHFPGAALDAFVVMPNHVHGIVWIGDGTVGANDDSPLPPPSTTPSFRSPSKTIGSMVRGFKIGVTKWMRANTDIHDVWQRNYYEHIIQDESALNRIRQYVADNPARWAEDAENPARWSHLPDHRNRRGGST